MIVKSAVALAPSPLNALLENVPILSEALLNKPVDRVLLGSVRSEALSHLSSAN